jgi:hypothetical protein
LTLPHPSRRPPWDPYLEQSHERDLEQSHERAPSHRRPHPGLLRGGARIGADAVGNGVHLPRAPGEQRQPSGRELQHGVYALEPSNALRDGLSGRPHAHLRRRQQPSRTDHRDERPVHGAAGSTARAIPSGRPSTGSSSSTSIAPCSSTRSRASPAQGTPAEFNSPYRPQAVKLGTEIISRTVAFGKS